jgi:hypothetical protein
MAKQRGRRASRFFHRIKVQTSLSNIKNFLDCCAETPRGSRPREYRPKSVNHVSWFSFFAHARRMCPTPRPECRAPSGAHPLWRRPDMETQQRDCRESSIKASLLSRILSTPTANVTAHVATPLPSNHISQKACVFPLAGIAADAPNAYLDVGDLLVYPLLAKIFPRSYVTCVLCGIPFRRLEHGTLHVRTVQLSSLR